MEHRREDTVSPLPGRVRGERHTRGDTGGQPPQERRPPLPYRPRDERRDRDRITGRASLLLHRGRPRVRRGEDLDGDAGCDGGYCRGRGRSRGRALVQDAGRHRSAGDLRKRACGRRGGAPALRAHHPGGPVRRPGAVHHDRGPGGVDANGHPGASTCKGGHRRRGPHTAREIRPYPG